MSEGIVALFCMGWLAGALTTLVIISILKKEGIN